MPNLETQIWIGPLGASTSLPVVLGVAKLTSKFNMEPNVSKCFKTRSQVMAIVGMKRLGHGMSPGKVALFQSD